MCSDKLVLRFGDDFLMSEVRLGVDDTPHGRRVSLDTPREAFSLDATQCRDLDSWLHHVLPALGKAPKGVRRAWQVRCGDPVLKLVLLVLIDHLDPVGTVNWVDVAVRDLACWCELTPERVAVALAGLRALNLIRPVSHGMGGEQLSIEINPEVA